MSYHASSSLPPSASNAKSPSNDGPLHPLPPPPNSYHAYTTMASDAGAKHPHHTTPSSRHSSSVPMQGAEQSAWQSQTQFRQSSPSHDIYGQRQDNSRQADSHQSIPAPGASKLAQGKGKSKVSQGNVTAPSMSAPEPKKRKKGPATEVVTSRAGTPETSALTVGSKFSSTCSIAIAPAATPELGQSSLDTPSGSGTASNSNNMAKKRTTSCENCRRRKLKCDRRAPCGACIDRNECSLCTWEEGVQPIMSGRHTVVPGPLIDRMDRLEAIMLSLATKMGAQVNLPPIASSSGQDEAALDSPANQSADDGGVAAALAGLKYAMSSGPGGTAAAAAAAGAGAGPGPGSAEHQHRRMIPSSNKAEEASIWSATQEQSVSGWAQPGTFTFAWHKPEDAAREGVLWKILDLLPDTQTVRKLCEVYFRDASFLHYCVDPDIFWNRLREHEEMRLMWKGRSKMHWGAQLRSELTFVALILAMASCALLYTDDQEQLSALNAKFESPIATFIDAAMRALDAVESVQYPSADSVRSEILIGHVVSAARGSNLGLLASVMTIQNGICANLDLEPPAHISRTEMLDRMRVWVNLCMSDWFGSTSSRRMCMIPDGSENKGGSPTPSFLYSNSAWDIASIDGPWPVELKIRFEMGRILRKASERQQMDDESGFQLTMGLQKRFESLTRTIPAELRVDVLADPDQICKEPFDGKRMFWRQCMMACLSEIVIMSLHRRYYVQGWLDPRYRISRDLCFKSAHAFVLLFLEISAVSLPIEELMSRPKHEAPQILKSKRGFIARGSFLARLATSGALLLQHHVFMMDAHPDQASVQDLNQRNTFVAKLRKLKQILLLLGPDLSIPPSEISALQPFTEWDAGSSSIRTNSVSAADTPSCPSFDPVGPVGSNDNLNRAGNAGHISPVGRKRSAMAAFGSASYSNAVPMPRQHAANPDLTNQLKHDAALVNSQPWFQALEAFVFAYGPWPVIDAQQQGQQQQPPTLTLGGDGDVRDLNTLAATNPYAGSEFGGLPPFAPPPSLHAHTNGTNSSNAYCDASVASSPWT
ncbi:hypothetical protein K437DRAFT_275251 [Tilletiaria anomala UBC 951]|uniref:Zn(2)-C6 fungal-type domain-containing protein n=1 Tax=Tilletiaria anomala (strain ATCC 24038 / CBS 436.72 / UBC 951) TaxID=1037660 RepID=A0A066VP44_TILAU|nr:uncharacterized protein K437DRAFT_275251 [Tilletiaria anomala UBC 951]KDN42073.1 hypothetical protein K437DRAFT_275251 [Tilletiaria anomala UBC 951]